MYTLYVSLACDELYFKGGGIGTWKLRNSASLSRKVFIKNRTKGGTKNTGMLKQFLIKGKKGGRGGESVSMGINVIYGQTGH